MMKYHQTFLHEFYCFLLTHHQQRHLVAHHLLQSLRHRGHLQFDQDLEWLEGTAMMEVFHLVYHRLGQAHQCPQPSLPSSQSALFH